MSSNDRWDLADALMGYHLAHTDLIGDHKELTLWEIAELSGMPYCDIMEVYDSGISKVAKHYGR